jgi:AcrR family transcriptional regulator
MVRDSIRMASQARMAPPLDRSLYYDGTERRNGEQVAATPTKERIIEASAALMGRQGYNGTGVKQIVAAAEAPFGSIYHFFPGGKEEIGAEAIRRSGATYERLIPAVFDAAPDVVAGIRAFFNGAAAHLAETDYADACPIATIALETSSSSEPMRMACHDVFEGWITAGVSRFSGLGLGSETTRQLVMSMVMALEGAFLLARACRDTTPLTVAAEMVVISVERAMAATP